jgi:hypothetical protein
MVVVVVCCVTILASGTAGVLTARAVQKRNRSTRFKSFDCYTGCKLESTKDVDDDGVRAM